MHWKCHALALALTVTCACQQFNNRFNSLQHECAVDDWAPFRGKALFRIRTPDGSTVPPSAVGRVSFLKAQGRTEALSLSKGGCLALPLGATGRIEATLPSHDLGLAYEVSGKASTRGIQDLVLSRIEPISLAIACPEKRVVGDPRALWLPAHVTSGSMSPGTRLVMELNQGDRRLFLENEDAFSSANREIPDGSYSIQARAIDLLGRTSSSPACVLHLDSRVPQAPRPAAQLVSRDDGILEFSSPDAKRKLVCFERAADPVGKCLLEANFSEFTDFVRVPGAGKWRAYLLSESEAGRRSPIESFEVAGDALPPELSLRWKNPELNGPVSAIPRLGTTLSVNIALEDDATNTDGLSKHLECRVEFSQRLGVATKSPDAKCTTGPCEGQSLDEFRPCSDSFSFQIEQEENHFDEEVRAIVRVTDQVGRTTEKRISTWLFRNATQPWHRHSDNGLHRAFSARQIVPFPGQPDAALVAATGILSIGNSDLNFPDGAWGGSPGQESVSRFFIRNGELWFAWGRLHVNRIPLKSPNDLKTWTIPIAAEECINPDWMAADGDSGAIVSCNDVIFRYNSHGDTWSRDLSLEQEISTTTPFVSESGELWLLRDTELIRWDNGKVVERFPTPDGFSFLGSLYFLGFQVKKVPQGRIMWARDSSGRTQSFLLDDGFLRPLPELSGFEGAIDFDAAGRVAVLGETLSLFQNGIRQISVDLPSEFYEHPITAFALAPNGRVWASAGDSALYSFDSQPRAYPFSAALMGMKEDDFPRDLKTAKDSLVVLSGSGALRRFRENRWETLSTPRNEPATALHLSRDGRMWVVTESSQIFWRRQDGEWNPVPFALATEDTGGDCFMGCSFHETEKGEIFLQTQAGSFIWTSEGTFKSISSRYGEIRTMSDNMGRAWGALNGKACLFNEEHQSWSCMDGIELISGERSLPVSELPSDFEVESDSQGRSFALYRGIVYELTDNHRWMRLQEEPPCGASDCDAYTFASFKASPDGSLWLISNANKLIRGHRQGIHWIWEEVFTDAKGLSSLFWGPKGEIWLKTGSTLSVLPGN